MNASMTVAALVAPWVAVTIVCWSVRRVRVVRSRSRLRHEPWGVALACAIHGTTMRRVVFDPWRGVTYVVLRDGTVEEFAPLQDRPAPPAPWATLKRRPSCDPRQVRACAFRRIVAVTAASFVAWLWWLSAWNAAGFVPAARPWPPLRVPVDRGVVWFVGMLLSVGLAGVCRPIGGIVCDHRRLRRTEHAEVATP